VLILPDTIGMSTSGEPNRERSESIRPKYFGMGRGLHATVVPHCGIGLDGFAEIVDDGTNARRQVATRRIDDRQRKTCGKKRRHQDAQPIRFDVFGDQ
jgi:hypothetical protein